MPINAVLDVREETPLYGYTEPVSLEFAKSQYSKIDFNEEDELLQVLLVVARELIERFTGLSLVQKTFTVIVNNEDGGIEIPYGPTPNTIDVTTILDRSGEVINEDLIVIIGNQFKYIDSPCYPYIQLMYTAGYVTEQQSLTEGGVPIPSALKLAICAQFFFLYENRGERLSYSSGGVRDYNVGYICDAARQLCNKYSRNTELSL